MRIVETMRENGSIRIQHFFDDEEVNSKVEQGHEKDCDINQIMKRARKRGFLERSQRVPQFGDFSSGQNFHDVMNQIHEAESQFGMLPAEVRSKFKNDAGLLLDWLNDPQNADEAAELGLIDVEAPAVEPVPEVAAEPVPAAPEGTPEPA